MAQGCHEERPKCSGEQCHERAPLAFEAWLWFVGRAGSPAPPNLQGKPWYLLPDNLFARGLFLSYCGLCSKYCLCIKQH